MVLLGLPVLLYLFLQRFGENKYQVPVFYEQGIDNAVSPDCPEHQTTHRINRYNASGTNLAHSLLNERITVVGFAQSGCDFESSSELASICNQFKRESNFRAITMAVDTSAVSIKHTELVQQYIIPADVWTLLPYQTDTRNLVQCGFNLKLDCNLSQQLILVDPESRIRGYYLITDANEMDRLAMEINILLQENSADQ